MILFHSEEWNYRKSQMGQTYSYYMGAVVQDVSDYGTDDDGSFFLQFKEIVTPPKTYSHIHFSGTQSLGIDNLFKTFHLF